VSTRPQRHAAILRLVREEAVPSQERLRELLAGEGYRVTQATLSRDIRALGVVKMVDEEGRSHYAVPAAAADPAPALRTLLPSLLIAADAADNLLVLKTLTGGAQPVAVALDHQHWDDVVGTIAGDDTILIITRSAEACRRLRRRVETLAGPRSD